MATRRPTLAESSEKARALVCAFAAVPGPSAVGVRAEQVLLGFSETVDVDALTLKATHLTHIQRVGKARMLRVPVPDLVSGEHTAARGPFLERLSTFKRALQRQLEADSYNVVVALDLFAGGAAAEVLAGSNLGASTKLVIEVPDVPSLSFAARYPVDADDVDMQKRWDVAERRALKAASMVLVPSRQAARVVSERTDPRLIRVVPRMVDTRVFQPPSVEIALDDVKTVAFLGGREGGARSLAVTATVKALLQQLPDARVLVLGTPSRAERQLVDELARRGLMERVVPVDVSDQSELVQALAAAHVVVVPAGADGDVYGLPHRALEAMARGRAVVVTGAEAAYKDALQNNVHARVVAVTGPGAADEIAAAVKGLVDDDAARGALARAGLRQAQKHDLAARLPDLGALLSEGSGVLFEAQLPPLEEVTGPASIARPSTPLPPPPNTKPTTTTTKPAAKAPPKKKSAKSLLPQPPTSLPLPTRPPAAAFVSDEGATGGADVWAGDTMLDPAIAAPSDPVPEKVKGAMLVTTSGSAEAGAQTTAESSAPRAAKTALAPVLSTPTRSGGGAAPRSLLLAVDDGDGEDDWSRDTIADASPVVADPTRGPRTSEKPPLTHPPRSLLVEAGIGDMTAEDKAATSHSEDSSSEEDSSLEDSSEA